MRQKNNSIRIPVWEIASSLGMPEMPDQYLLGEKTATLYENHSEMPEEGLQIMAEWQIKRAFEERKDSRQKIQRKN